MVLMLRETAAPTHHRALLPVRPWKPGGLTADPAEYTFLFRSLDLELFKSTCVIIFVTLILYTIRSICKSKVVE